MVKVTLSKKDIEKFLKDQFNPNTIKWKQDEIEMDIDLEDLKKKEEIRITTYPVIVEKVVPRYPYWYWTKPSTTGSSYTINYCNSTGGSTKC